MTIRRSCRGKGGEGRPKLQRRKHSVAQIRNSCLIQACSSNCSKRYEHCKKENCFHLRFPPCFFSNLSGTYWVGSTLRFLVFTSHLVYHYYTAMSMRFYSHVTEDINRQNNIFDEIQLLTFCQNLSSIS